MGTVQYWVQVPSSTLRAAIVSLWTVLYSILCSTSCIFFQCCGSGPVSGAFLTSWTRDGKKSGYGIWNKHYGSYFQYRSLVTIFGLKIFQFFVANRDPGSDAFFDPGWKISDPGSASFLIRDGKIPIRDPVSGINIPDPHHCLFRTPIFLSSLQVLFRVTL